MKIYYKFIIILFFCSLNTNIYAQLQQQLTQLNNKISKLYQTLNSTKNKRDLLNNELLYTDKSINNYLQQINQLKNTNSAIQNKINNLTAQIQKLNADLKQQQHLLAQHVVIFYKMQYKQKIILFLTQNNLKDLDQYLTLSQYLINARQNIINNIIHTKQALNINKQQLQKKQIIQQQLAKKLQLQQQNITSSKQYDRKLIQLINQKINTTQYTLSQYHQKKANLQKLLTTFAKNIPSQNKYIINNKTFLPFQQMRHKLSLPININHRAIEKDHYKLIFPAPEGAPVHALYSGHVVFSDWFNGYGLLLIIDHGQGFMTLYAHNQAFNKQRGDIVKCGEQIATVGHSGGFKKNGLYFEIRRNGKIISPFEWFI